MRLLAIALLSCAACSVRLTDRARFCTAERACPQGLHCASGMCVVPGAPPDWGVDATTALLSEADLARAGQAGAQVALVEVAWEAAEPAEGARDGAHFAALRDRNASLRELGLELILHVDLERAPAWLLDKPNARFQDQDGEWSSFTPQPNLVWNRTLRPHAEAFLEATFVELGTDFVAVRVGGGHVGSISFPGRHTANGTGMNEYWAWDATALTENTKPGKINDWRPGDPETANGEGTLFLNWYLNALGFYQNWLVGAVARFYPGTIAVTYCCRGMLPGDFQSTVDTGFDGLDGGEQGGNVQRGNDHVRHIEMLPANLNAAVWMNTAEWSIPTQQLAQAANARGLLKLGIVRGGAPSKVLDTLSHARTYGLRYWLFRPEEGPGNATLDDVIAIASGQ